MIAKRAHRRKDSKSSFSTLVEYITRDGKAAQKDGIEYSRITHCGFDTLDAAILEIEATQARNTRSKIDKTYHLIVSFQEDEVVGQEKLFDIEDEICRAIGLGGHQRVSAAHQDTDNQHLHIAINKIHPINHLAIEPYYDYMKLDKACAALEFKHELQTDNRIADTQDRALDETLQSGKAGDMEAYNGMNSFQRWIGERKEDICQHLSTAKSWADVHKGLGQYGLTIRPRGAGMVISAKKAKAFMKASELGRKFSKGALESRFGAYQPTSKETEIEDFSVIQSYRKVPRSRGGKLSSPLWDTYRDEKDRIVAEKKLAKDEVWQQRSQQIKKGRSDYAAKRRAVKIDTLLNRYQKREVYSRLYRNNKLRVKTERDSHRETMKVLHERYPVKTWKDFLIDHAAAGDPDAVVILRRSHRGKRKERGSAFLGTDEGQILLPMERQTKPNGDVLYQADGVNVRDTGKRLEMDSDGVKGLAKVLRMARFKFGDHIQVSGDAKFKAAVVDIATDSKQSVIFADPEMEKRRKVLHLLKHPPAPVKKKEAGWSIADDLYDDLGR